MLFHSRSGENRGGYANPEVDRLLEQARVEQNQQARFRLYHQAEQVIVRDAAWVPLWHGKQFILVKPYVTGFRASPVIQPWLRDVGIKGNPEGRTEIPRPEIPTPAPQRKA